MFAAEVPEEHIQEALQGIKAKYDQEEFAFGLYDYAEGYQFLTKPAYQASIKILLKQASKKRLSTSSIETLAIIAYKQPISRGAVASIRAVAPARAAPGVGAVDHGDRVAAPREFPRGGQADDAGAEDCDVHI